MKLHHEVLTTPGSSPTRALVMLHGILGSGGNLRGLARPYIEASQGRVAAVLIDLRAHGQSQSAPGNADTVAHAADDVAETLSTLPFEPFAVVGHSFGGKVALALDHSKWPHVMTLDSAPGPRPDARGSERTFEVLDLLGRLPGPWTSRDQFIEQLVAGGQKPMLAQWLAMNLVRAEGAASFTFRLDLKRINTLLDDYLNVDLWPVLESPKTNVHVVVALSSKVFEHEDRVRAQTLESSTHGRVTVDLLEGTHWIHVDNTKGVVEVMKQRLVGW